MTEGLSRLTHGGEHVADLAAGLRAARRWPRGCPRGPARPDVRVSCDVEPCSAEPGDDRRARSPPPRGTRCCRTGTGRPSPWGAATWPRSPAAPCAPRWSCPPVMMPAPMPVATLTNTGGRRRGSIVACSPSAMMLTSLSTSTGTAEAGGDVRRHVVAVPARHDRRDWRGGRWSARPARAARCRRRRGRPACAPASSSSSRRASMTRSSTGPGPLGDVELDGACSVSTVPSRSVTADGRVGRAEVGRDDDARRAGLKAKRAGGRPPVERASPPGPSSPAASSASTRAPTVDRARPVTWTSSARVRGRPSRMSWSSAPAPVGAVGGGMWPGDSRAQSSTERTFCRSHVGQMCQTVATFA